MRPFNIRIHKKRRNGNQSRKSMSLHIHFFTVPSFWKWCLQGNMFHRPPSFITLILVGNLFLCGILIHSENKKRHQTLICYVTTSHLRWLTTNKAFCHILQRTATLRQIIQLINLTLALVIFHHVCKINTLSTYFIQNKKYQRFIFGIFIV